MAKRAQAAMNANGSAILIIIVTALIVLYILFLPPQDRAELLGETSGIESNGGWGSNGDAGTAPSTTLLLENVGSVDYQSSDEHYHTIPSFRIGTKTEGGILKNIDSLYVKSSVFETIIENITFRIDPDVTSDARFSFNVDQQASGRLMVVLNGKQIIDKEYLPSSSQYIDLPGEQLQAFNVLTIGVSTPGWAFWRMHEYQLSTLQITGDVKDLTGAQAMQSFILDDEEVDSLDRASLRFYADCTPSETGRLTIKVNGRTVFSGYADCGVLNTVELDRRMLDWGQNEVSFITEEGTYLITNIDVKTELEEPVYPIYYFDIDSVYFTEEGGDEDAVCGEVDGECPDDCSPDVDKDCCFEEDDDYYWCDLETAQLGDRCVSFVTASTCSRCGSGYEDEHGKAPAVCEEWCGDDHDGDCPLGCSKYIDRDCCFEDWDENYWCDDIPLGRPLSAVCKPGVEPDERSACPDRYYNKDGRHLSYTADDEDEESEEELRGEYEAVMELEFPNTDLKSATLVVNGRDVGLKTYDTSWSWDISDYVRSGPNSVQVVPGRSIDITSLKVSVKRQ
ncbi:hypothetical protein GF367_01450 [Candidatus Woesearchaeota archaeon]|nr:hypothetical protein [Candidatus Woesearchaeota archaeon]